MYWVVWLYIPWHCIIVPLRQYAWLSFCARWILHLCYKMCGFGIIFFYQPLINNIMVNFILLYIICWHYYYLKFARISHLLRFIVRIYSIVESKSLFNTYIAFYLIIKSVPTLNSSVNREPTDNRQLIKWQYIWFSLEFRSKD